MNMLMKSTDNILGGQELQMAARAALYDAEPLFTVTVDGRIIPSKKSDYTLRPSLARINSANVVWGQTANINVLVREGEWLILHEGLAGHGDTNSHWAKFRDTKPSWEECYGKLEFGKAALMILYHNEPRQTDINFEGSHLEDVVALNEDIRENWFTQEITYVGTFVSALPRTEQLHISDPNYKRLINRLWAAFDSEVLEDGMDHPAEQIIDDAVTNMENQPIYQWFRAIALDVDQPGFASSVLRCLGRHQNVGTIRWRSQLVREALEATDVEIRDAAIQAVETWRDRRLVGVVRDHTESVPWLQRYIRDVIDYLGE